MKFEIPLTEKQRNLLAIAQRIDAMPHLMPVRHLKKYTLNWTHDDLLSERYCAFDQQTEAELQELSQKHDELHSQYPHITRQAIIDAPEGVKSLYSAKDWHNWKNICDRNNSLLDTRQNARGVEYERLRRICRSLYGIIGIVRGCGRNHPFFTRGYVIPFENTRAVNSALDECTFTKEFEKKDLQVLQTIYQRTNQVVAGRPHSYSPCVSVPRLVTECSINRAQAEHSVQQLTGILCHVYGPKSSLYTLQEEKLACYWNNWFIPRSKMELAREVLYR